MNKRAENRVKDGMREKGKQYFSNINLKLENHDIQTYTTECVMLPIWILNIKHGKKNTFAVNGQTGKVVGDLPIDKIKLTLIAIGSFLASNILVGLICCLWW